MNVFLLTDLEGVPGVTSIDYVDKENPLYGAGCRLLEHYIDFVTAICRRCGAETVWYWDGHGGGGNVKEENLKEGAIRADCALWEQLLTERKIDCQIELGSHARAGTVGGFLDHTINSRRWFCHTVNGRESSELSIHAAVCGAYSVPIAVCIGDEAACEQAKEYIPRIHTAAVKKAERRNVCTDYPDADARIEQAVREGLADHRNIPPYRTSLPAEVRLTLYRTDFCEEMLAHCTDPAVTRPDARTLAKTIPALTHYADLKF